MTRTLKFIDGSPVPADYQNAVAALVRDAADGDPGEGNEPVLHIIVFRDRCGRWNYCPASIRHEKFMDYGDGEDGFDTRELALEAATHDASIPVGSRITVEEPQS